MAVLEVTARQFRENQKSFFDIADKGRQIVIKRGRKQSYILTAVEEDDFVVTPELWAKIERAEQDMREGKVTVCKTLEDNYKFLDSL
jgi:tRNA nucleotidyltransferase (CCA-adding enzyme)